MRLTQRHMLQIKNLALEQKHHTQCDQCQISQRKITKIFLLKEESFKSVQQISEGDWRMKSFPGSKLREGTYGNPQVSMSSYFRVQRILQVTIVHSLTFPDKISYS